MKKIAIILLFLGVFFPHFAAAVDKLQLRNEQYILQNVREAPFVQDGWTNQYIRANENIDNWTKMVMIQTYPHVTNSAGAAEHLYNSYKRQKNVLLTPIQGASRSASVFSFILLNTSQTPVMYEGNVIRFSNADEGTTTMQYIERIPVDDPTDTKARQRIEKTLQNKLGPIIRIYKKTTTPSIVKEMKK